jgi:hypothetical protein
LRISSRSCACRSAATPQSIDRQLELLRPGKTGQRQVAAEQPLDDPVRQRRLGRAHAFDGDAVVGGEDQQLRVAELRLERALHQPQAQRQRLQLAQVAAAGAAPAQHLGQFVLELRVRGRRNQRAGGLHGRQSNQRGKLQRRNSR